jgi:hypothetical protein
VGDITHGLSTFEYFDLTWSDGYLQLEGTDDRIEIEAGFIDSPGVDALLGQDGFFEHFRICFDRPKEEIEIRPILGI